MILAIVISIIDHMRPQLRAEGLGARAHGRLATCAAAPVAPDARTLDGLVVYHFAASLYYANANRFSEEILSLTGEDEPPVRWLCVDASAIADVDYSGAETLERVAAHAAGARHAVAVDRGDAATCGPSSTATASPTRSVPTPTSTRSATRSRPSAPPPPARRRRRPRCHRLRRARSPPASTNSRQYGAHGTRIASSSGISPGCRGGRSPASRRCRL